MAAVTVTVPVLLDASTPMALAPVTVPEAVTDTLASPDATTPKLLPVTSATLTSTVEVELAA